MARDQLMPGGFARIGRYGTPTWGIITTSVLMAICIVAFDVRTVAKLASAFQLTLFALVNVCVIVMRESRLEYYQPVFKSPLYPWMQFVGIVVPIWLIAEMGWVAMAFTAGLIALCTSGTNSTQQAASRARAPSSTSSNGSADSVGPPLTTNSEASSTRRASKTTTRWTSCSCAPR